MSKYIEVDALRDKLGRSFIDMDDSKFECPAEINGMLDYAIDCVKEQPTADVVEVVRCQDCTWWKSIFSWNGKEHKVCVRESTEPPRESDDYCSFGERREDDKGRSD